MESAYIDGPQQLTNPKTPEISNMKKIGNKKIMDHDRAKTIQISGLVDIAVHPRPSRCLEGGVFRYFLIKNDSEKTARLTTKKGHARDLISGVAFCYITKFD